MLQTNGQTTLTLESLSLLKMKMSLATIIPPNWNPLISVRNVPGDEENEDVTGYNYPIRLKSSHLRQKCTGRWRGRQRSRLSLTSHTWRRCCPWRPPDTTGLAISGPVAAPSQDSTIVDAAHNNIYLSKIFPSNNFSVLGIFCDSFYLSKSTSRTFYNGCSSL